MLNIHIYVLISASFLTEAELPHPVYQRVFRCVALHCQRTSYPVWSNEDKLFDKIATQCGTWKLANGKCQLGVFNYKFCFDDALNRPHQRKQSSRPRKFVKGLIDKWSLNQNKTNETSFQTTFKARALLFVLHLKRGKYLLKLERIYIHHWTANTLSAKDCAL